MSLEFYDGFDHYNNATNYQRKWDTATTGTAVVTGRFGGQAGWLSSATAVKTLTAVQTRVCGFAFYFNAGSLSATNTCQFMDAGTTQVNLIVTSAGALQVTRNGTQLGITAGGVIVGLTWYYIEMKVKIDPTTGTYEVRVNGVNVLSGTGANTRATANSTTNQLQMGPFASAGIYIDDLYVCNTSGSVNNDFLGECRILTSLPTGDGASTNWTPSTGANHWANVDDNPPNDDTDYNSDSTVGDIDLYTFPSVSPTGAIGAVQVTICARKDDAGVRQLSEVCRSGGTNFVGANTFTMASTYSMYREIMETDPNTSAAWTNTGVNNAQFGVKVIA